MAGQIRKDYMTSPSQKVGDFSTRRNQAFDNKFGENELDVDSGSKGSLSGSCGAAILQAFTVVPR